MKYKIILLTLTTLFFSNVFAMNQMDKAINNCDVGWVHNLLKKYKFTDKQKKQLLEAANASVSDWRYTSKSLFRSPRDLIRLLFGLGTNGTGCLIIILGLTGAGATILCSDKLGPIRLNSNDTDAIFLKSSLGLVA